MIGAKTCVKYAENMLAVLDVKGSDPTQAHIPDQNTAESLGDV